MNGPQSSPRTGRATLVAGLLLLLLAGGGVATRIAERHHAGKPQETSGRAERAAPVKARHGREDSPGERELLATLDRWFEQPGAFPPEMTGAMQRVIDHLSLEATRKILAAHDQRNRPGIARMPAHPEILALVAEHFGALAPQEVAAILFPDTTHGDPGPHYPYLEEMLIGMARENPALAFRTWYEPNHPAEGGLVFFSTTINARVMQEVVRLWAAADPAAARGALTQVSDEERAKFYPGFAAGLSAATDWAAEAGRFTGIFPGWPGLPVSSAGPANSLAARWAASDPDAAFDWLRQRPEILSAPAGGYGAVSDWLAAEPARAAAWLTQNTPVGMERADLLPGLVISETNGDPRAAREALALLDSSEARDAAVRKALEQPAQHVEVLRVWEASPLLSPEVTAEVSAAIEKALHPKPPLILSPEFHFDYRLPSP